MEQKLVELLDKIGNYVSTNGPILFEEAVTYHLINHIIKGSLDLSVWIFILILAHTKLKAFLLDGYNDPVQVNITLAIVDVFATVIFGSFFFMHFSHLIQLLVSPHYTILQSLF